MIDDIEKNYVIPSYKTRKYDKFLVTIALRLGIEIKEPEDIKLNFKGSFSEHNNKLIHSNPSTNPQKHDSYNYLGSLTVNGQAYSETEVKICTPRQDQNLIKTLWPVFKDSYRSQIFNHTKTRDFIEEYGSDRLNLTIYDIANYYHPLFLKNPARSPLSMALDVDKTKAVTRRKMHKADIDKLIADQAEKEARAKKEFKEREKEFKKREKEYQENLAQAIKKSQASEGSPNQETKKSNSDVDIERTSYILTHQIISDLNNTKYTFKKTFNVINTYLIPGEEFRKHYGFSWSRPMILIETDLGWYIDSASNSNGNTKWTPGEHQNCRISLTKGKHLPYWLEKY